MTLSADTETAAHEAPPPRLGWAGEGARQALRGPAFIVAVSLIGVGGLARDAVQSVGAAVVSTLLIWAGPAQVIYFAGLAAHAAPLTLALAILLTGVRFLPMCVALLPMLRGPRTGRLTLIFAAHLVALTVWVESMRRLPLLPGAARLPFFFGFAGVCIIASAAATGLGYWLVALMPPFLAAGLLLLSPIYFLASLTRGAKDALDWTAIGLGLALMPAASAVLSGGFDLMAVGLAGGGAAYAVRRLTRAGAAR